MTSRREYNVRKLHSMGIVITHAAKPCRQGRKKPNTTSRTTPLGVRAASMVRQGGKEYLEGSLAASRAPKIEEREEDRRGNGPWHRTSHHVDMMPSRGTVTNDAPGPLFSDLLPTHSDGPWQRGEPFLDQRPSWVPMPL
jgi:hypothetical protein